MSEPISVVCGVVLREGAVLVAQRQADSAEALRWEFPGGKVEPGETPQAALQRELREELGIEVRVGDLFQVVLHEYSDRTVHLMAFIATIAHGEPRPLQCRSLRWMPVDRLDDLDLCAADLPIKDRLCAQIATSGSPGHRRPSARNPV